MMGAMKPNQKQSQSKLAGTGASPRKNLRMSSTWKKLNVKQTHTHRGKRG